ncbi:MAG TPA: DUF4352 domain-containing protein [Pseudonocardia sp.]
MRHTAIAVTAVLCLGLAGCTNPDVTSKPDANPPAATAAGQTASDAPAEQPKQAAKIGDTITVKGSGDGEQVAVTIKKVADPAKPGDEFSAPAQGNRWIGIQVEIVNTGDAVYADSPGNGMQIADTDGQRFGTTFADISAGPSMTSDAKLSKGAKALGWIVFEVPKTSKAATVQFAANSGFADQTAEWKLQ